MIGFDIKGSRGMRVRKNRSRDRVTEKLGYDLFHRASSERSVKAVADEKLDGVRMDFEVIEAFLPKDFQLLRDGELCDLDLSIEGERLEDDLVCKAPHELRPEGSGEFAQH
jgi:hypothetical protein